MKHNADDPQQSDFHPWPHPLGPGQLALIRKSFVVVLLGVVVVGAFSTDLTFVRVIVNCVIVYVVVKWARQWLSENKEGPGRPGPQP